MILTHPDNIKELAAAGTPIDNVVVDRNLPAKAPIGKHIFPEWPFCEFEENEEWAIRLGMTHREMIPVVFQITKPDWLKPLPMEFSLQKYKRPTNYYVPPYGLFNY